MARKNDEFYFDSFIEGVDCACRMATELKRLLDNFNYSTLKNDMQILHDIENEGDNIKHKTTEALVKAFITPIERDDIYRMNDNIDQLTDAIEDIVIHVYTNNVRSMRADVKKYTELLCKACDAVKRLVLDFKNFPKSKELGKIVIEINRIEEEADAIYIAALKDLHTNCKDAVEVVAWREIYHYFEYCFDASEHIADVVESIVITNT